LAVVSALPNGQVDVAFSSSINLDRCGPAELPYDARVAMALKRLLDQASPNTRRAVLLIDGQSVFSRVVTLPPVAADRVEQTIRHEAVQNIPFPLEEVVWDSVIFDPDALEKEVLLAAVKADLVNGLIHAATANGLKVERILPAPVALANAVRLTMPASEKCTLLVESDASSANLVFVEGGRLFFRSVPGGDESRLSQEVARSISFYTNQRGGSAPARTLVAGEAKPEHLDVEAEQFIPGFVQYAGNDHPVAAVGAAAAGGFAINLVSAHMQDEGASRLRGALWAYILIGALMMGAVWGWYLNWAAGRIAVQHVDVSRQVSELASIEDQLIPIENNIERILSEYDMYLAIDRERGFWRDTLVEVEALLPDGMFLLSSMPIDQDGGSGGLQVTVVSYLDKETEGQDAVKLLRDAFRQSDRFSRQSKISSRPSKQAFVRSFVLDLVFAEGER
jgi:hypothetical protein